MCFFFGRGGDPPIEGYAGIHKIERDVVYLCTCVLCDVRKRELVHFGKLTPPLAVRIPELQMPAFKSFTNERKKGSEKL